MFQFITHSRIKRATEDCSEIASKTTSAIILVISVLVCAAILAVISSKYSGAALFLVTLIGGLIGYVIPWFAFYVFCFWQPIPRFDVDVGKLTGIAEDLFGITPRPNAKHYGIGTLELRARLPDGTVCDWLEIPYKTFCGSETIFIVQYPQVWPLQEGEYDLVWRSPRWGNPPLVIANGKFQYKNGSWSREKEIN